MSRPDGTPSPEDLPDVFEQATAEARERILHDAKRFDGDAPAAAFLEYLADHLFDPGLDVDSWRRACSLPRRTYLRVVEELGPLKPYLDDLRVAVASRLVLETGMDLSDLGRRVGYTVPRTFRRAFRRLHGKSPQELRAARDVSSAADGHDVEGSEDDEEPGKSGPAEAELSLRARAARWRRRFALGLYDRRQAAELRRLLRRRYPCLEEEEADSGVDSPFTSPWVRTPVRILSTSDRLGWFAAECVVGRALTLPDPEMRRAFVHGIRFGDLVGIYLLHNVSFRLLQHDHRKAVEVAELAVEMAEAHPEKRAGDHADWRALAWAALGRIRLDAGDRASADAAFVHARTEWETPREQTLPKVEAQVRRHEAELRKVQRRFEDVAVLLDRVAEIGRETGVTALLVESRLERADLARIAGDPETAVEILEEVLAGPPPPMEEQPEGRHEAHFRSLVLFKLAKAHLAAGGHEEAAARLDETRRLLAGEPLFFKADLDRQEARLCLRTGRTERAVELLRAARDAYEKSSTVLHGAAAAELAGVLAHLGRREDARAEAEKVLSFFERLPLHREALRAARLVRSFAYEEVPLSRVDELSGYLDVVVREVVSLPGRAGGSEEEEKPSREESGEEEAEA